MSCCSDKMEPIAMESCCTPRDTLQRAAQAMRETGCGCAPVVEDRRTRRLVGVVTERDVCHGTAADDRLASDVAVADVMRPASACCGENESLEDAQRKLDQHRTTSLPVVDKSGGCCGTISAHRLGIR